MGGRIGEVKRVTKETNVSVKINLDDESGVNKLRFWLKIVNDGVTVTKEVCDV
ncbi:unnamed protein product [Lupinus luteus]|uniref:Uncharacterized protein n=1 Tax=Lupinus luteus TaxID=3873 RepID=A0AAV1VY74_LUPLU